jgi:protease-4
MGAQRRKPLWFYLMLTLIICSTVVILVVGCVNLLGKGGGAQSSGGDFVPPSVKYVSKMYIVGEIGDYGDEYTSSQQSFHYRYTLDTIDSLIADPNNVGLVLYMNSPGGTVYESDEVYLKVMEYKEKTKRPVYVYMSSMAASGAYYIAAAADRIYANRNTWTGSIGVISGTFFDVSGFLKKHGIKATDIVSGRNKGMGSYFQPMTKEQRAILQSLVDEAYMQFVGIVSAGRGLTVEKTIELADGRIYTATQAKAAGLIDQVMGEQDAYADIRKTLGDEDLQIVDTVFEAQERLLDIFGMPINGKAAGGGAGAGASDSDAGASGADALSPGDIARVLDMVENADPFQLQYLFVG